MYGLMSDNLPICGYRRRPYLLLFAVLACLSYFALAVPWLSPGALIATLLLLVTSLSLAVSDVVVDARVVEMARRDPANGANDLQSICWSSLALGGFLGSLLSGPAVRYLKPRGVFLLAAIGPGIIVVLSLLMRESRVRRSREGCLPTAKAQGQQLLRALMLPVVWKSALFIFLSTASSPSFGQVCGTRKRPAARHKGTAARQGQAGLRLKGRDDLGVVSQTLAKPVGDGGESGWRQEAAVTKPLQLQLELEGCSWTVTERYCFRGWGGSTVPQA